MSLRNIFCRHNWVRISEYPSMVVDDESMCSFEIQYTCRKCKKVKNTWSDTYLGMRIVEDISEIRDDKLTKLGI